LARERGEERALIKAHRGPTGRSLHGAITQKIAIFILAAVRNYNFTK
jgi:hypothetical protein